MIEPPVSSIRWEMLREGIEDYEYLWLLRDLIGRKAGVAHGGASWSRYESLLEVPATITRDMTTFTTDPRRSTPAVQRSPRRSSSWRK